MVYIIDQDEPSEAFQAAWVAAAKHIECQCREGIHWIRISLERPFIEHLSFSIGNQLFFVFVEAEELEFSRRSDRFIGFAREVNAVPLVIKMEKNIGTYEPAHGGWGLLNAVTMEPVDPLALVSDELVELSDWELYVFAINIVKMGLLAEGKNVYSTCLYVDLNPSLWFEDNGRQCWVIVRGYRHPMVSPQRPENLDQIADSVQGEKSAGFYALVTVANVNDPFDPDAADNGNFISLHRGHGMVEKYDGIKPIIRMN